MSEMVGAEQETMRRRNGFLAAEGATGVGW